MTQHATTVRDQRGFTLVEMMVALVAGLIVVGAAITVFLSTTRTYAVTEDLGRVQENMRVAFELMVRDVREAAGNPCERNLPVYNVLKTPTAFWYTNFLAGVRGYDGTQPFADSAFGTATGNRIAGTDAVELKSAVSNGVHIVQHTPSSAQFKVSTVNHGLAPGDLALACDFGQVAVFQVTNAQPGINDTIVHNYGTGTPGNCSKGLGFGTPVNCSANGNLYAYGCYRGKYSGSGCDGDEDGVKNEPEDLWPALIAKLRMTRWYIGANERGGRSLYQANLRSDAAGNPVVDNNEVVEGVQGLRLRYLLTGAASYVDATAVTATDWTSDRIVAVSIDLTLEGTEPAHIDGVLQRRLQTIVTIRNQAQ